MDKETLSNYGWIVICVLIMAVMIALSTPFGTFIRDAIWSTTDGLFDVQEAALDTIIQNKTIYCWGDSLTESETISWTKYFTDLMNTGTKGYTVVNCGIGGENTIRIASRQGGHQLYVDEFTIPESGAVTISFKPDFSWMMKNGSDVLDPSNSHLQINPVTINGVKGILSRNSIAGFDYTFTRCEDGESVFVEDGTPMYTAAASACKDAINIIFTGTNDSNIEDIIKYQEEMINSLNSDKYIVIGLLSDGYFTNEELNSMNAKLAAKWGDHFVDAKTLLSSMNTKELKLLTSTFALNSGDEERMSNGLIPTACMYDDLVHLNKFGGAALAGFVYQKGIELNYWQNTPDTDNMSVFNRTNFEYTVVNEYDSVYHLGGTAIFGEVEISGIKDIGEIKNVEIKSLYSENGKTYIVTGVNETAWKQMQANTETLKLGVNYATANEFPICLTGGTKGTVAGTLALSDSSFKGFTKLKSITLSEGVKNVDTGMFVGCTTLETFNFPQEGFFTTLLGSTFRYCSNLKSVNFIPQSVTRMNATFMGCTQLTGTLSFKGGNVVFENGPIPKTVNNITFEAPQGSTTYANLEVLLQNFTGENITLVSK